VEQARTATFDLTTDEAVAAQKRASLSWDKKKKKFIKGGGEGADNVKLVKTESGTRLPASYRSGRFEEWKAKHRTSVPRVGEDEGDRARRVGADAAKRFRHNKVENAKPLDKLSKDYERKVRQLKKRSEGAGGQHEGVSSRGNKGPKRGKIPGGRYGSKSIGRVKSELKGVDQIHKGRKVYEQKRAKNARPSKKKGRR
jgi:ATP-dependent RNA helicase DDX54/DBP10